MEHSNHPRSAADRQQPLSLLTRRWLMFGSGWLLLAYLQGWQAGSATLLLAGVAAFLISALPAPLRRGAALCVLMLPAVLTATGSIGVLTGFAGNNQHQHWTGISFVCASLAAGLYRAPLTMPQWLDCVQPWRFNSGPCALPDTRSAPRRIQTRRLRSALSWILLGAFFYSVPAAALSPLLLLRQSFAAPDILLFALVFELYVYFNFSGISFMVYGLLKLAGLPVILNFQAPFSARHVPEFWQRWHISLSQVLKLLIFQPLRPLGGIWLAVPAVFLISALWHGVTLNFVLWGSFHACAWLVSHSLIRHGWRRSALALLAPVILTGRLIFSEADTHILLHKLQQLAGWRDAADSWISGISMDWQTATGLMCVAVWIGCEIAFPRQVRHYRLLRRTPVQIALLLLILLIGRSGLGGVYGAR